MTLYGPYIYVYVTNDSTYLMNMGSLTLHVHSYSTFSLFEDRKYQQYRGTMSYGQLFAIISERQTADRNFAMAYFMRVIIYIFFSKIFVLMYVKCMNWTAS